MYEVKSLSDKEFDDITGSDSRYSYVDDSNLGFADPLKRKAYVRHTNIHELNKYLISHELEELMANESSHEDPNGIRHKKGPKIFKDIILPAITGGLVPSQAPQREAAQTETIPGIGLVPRSQASAFQGFAQQQAPQQEALQNIFQAISGSGRGFGSPLNLFPSGPSGGNVSGTSQVPSSVGGGANITSGLSSGFGEIGNRFSPELLQKLRAGNYSGRSIAF